MNNPVKVQPLYNPAQGKPPSEERFRSRHGIANRGLGGMRRFVARSKLVST